MARRAAAGLLCVLLLLLGGCVSEEDDLLRLPQPPEHYVLLQKTLDGILKDNAEFSSPLNGYNRSAIQFVDIDGDGEDEILSFYKITKDNKTTMRVCLHKRQGDSYVELAQAEGLGDSIDVVYYPKFAHGTKTGIVLGWRLGSNPVCGVSAYLYENGSLRQLYSGEYTGLVVGDLDQDGDDELLLLSTTDTTQPGTASLLRYEGNELTKVSEQKLSAGISVPGRIRIVTVAKDLRAAVVDSQVFGRGYVSDILAVQNGALKNLLYREEAAQSVSTYRTLPFDSCDIDLDGFCEFPLCELMPGYSQTDTTESFWRTDWCRYTNDGKLSRVFSSYFNISDRWYMVLPDRISANVTVERGQNTEGERSIIFSEWNPSEGIKAGPLWEIYMLTGEDRFSRIESGELSELSRTYDTVYALKLYDNPCVYQLSATEIAGCFQLLQSEWVYENWAGAQTQNKS